jgi:protein-disulfide isomerase
MMSIYRALLGMMLIAFIGGTAAAQESDPVKAALEAAADVAAAAKAGELLRNPQSPVLGNPQGDVVLVKFVDYQCPYCKVIEPKLDKLLADDKGVKLVVKEFPILGPDSVVAAKVALAAGRQNKYAAYHHALMNHKGKLTTDVIFATAKDVGLDVERLRQDMNAPEIADQLLANFNLARSLKVSLTPAYIINTHVLSGVSVKTMTGQIDFPKEIAAARAKKP